MVLHLHGIAVETAAGGIHPLRFDRYHLPIGKTHDHRLVSRLFLRQVGKRHRALNIPQFLACQLLDSGRPLSACLNYGLAALKGIAGNTVNIYIVSGGGIQPGKFPVLLKHLLLDQFFLKFVDSLLKRFKVGRVRDIGDVLRTSWLLRRHGINGFGNERSLTQKER